MGEGLDKKIEVIIIPYKYRGVNSGFKEIPVYIVKGQESPDPFHKLYWGYKENGELLAGDYKGNFTKSGKPIKLEKFVDSSKIVTARQEDEEKTKLIRRYLKVKA